MKILVSSTSLKLPKEIEISFASPPEALAGLAL
jgi:hypothetical protein